MMKRLCLGLLLAWWFFHAAASSNTSGTMVGPFNTKEDCDKVAEKVMGGFLTLTTWCWWDGKP